MEGFDKRLQAILNSKKISQRKFSTMLGVEQTTVCAYCNGRRMPSAEVVARISELLDVSTDYLLGRKETFN